LDLGHTHCARNMACLLAASALAFAPPARLGRPAIAARTRASQQPTLLDNPIEAIASPLRKFEPSQAAPATGSPLDGLPIEVGLLFGAILLVGVAGLVKQSGVLDASAPTIGLGESRDELVSSGAAKPAAERPEPEDEKVLAMNMVEDEFKKRRGGSSADRKKKQKANKKK